MLNSRTIAAMAGVLGGLALLGAGATHAHGEAAAPHVCTHDAYGTYCSDKTERTYVSDDGSKVSVTQDWSCSTEQRNYVVRDERVQGNQGTVRQGTKMDCAPSIGG